MPYTFGGHAQRCACLLGGALHISWEDRGSCPCLDSSAPNAAFLIGLVWPSCRWPIAGLQADHCRCWCQSRVLMYSASSADQLVLITMHHVLAHVCLSVKPHTSGMCTEGAIAAAAAGAAASTCACAAARRTGGKKPLQQPAAANLATAAVTCAAAADRGRHV